MTELIAFNATDRIENATLSITEGDEEAVLEFEHIDGETTSVVMEREQAEAFVRQIEETYREHDGETGSIEESD